jgi:hypothetical protein
LKITFIKQHFYAQQSKLTGDTLNKIDKKYLKRIKPDILSEKPSVKTLAGCEMRKMIGWPPKFERISFAYYENQVVDWL